MKAVGQFTQRQRTIELNGESSGRERRTPSMGMQAAPAGGSSRGLYRPAYDWAIMSAQRSVKRSRFLSTSAALLGASFFGDCVTSAKAEEGLKVANSAKPSIVLCHGIWADGSSFSKVIPPLQAAGYEVIVT